MYYDFKQLISLIVPFHVILNLLSKPANILNLSGRDLTVSMCVPSADDKTKIFIFFSFYIHKFIPMI